MKSGLTRRELLRLTGATAAMVPLFQGSGARAEPPSGLRRLVIMCWPNGVNAREFWPSSGAGADYYGPLSGMPVMPTVIKPIFDAGVESHVLIPRNVINAAGREDPRAPTGHECYLHLLSGVVSAAGGGGGARSAGGPSVDQFIASKLPAVTTFRSLQFGNFTLSLPFCCATWRGVDAPQYPESRPERLYEALFGGGKSRDLLLTLRQRKLSILDAVHRELASKAPRLASTDRVRLEEHLDAVRQLERELDPQNLPSPQCTDGAKEVEGQFIEAKRFDEHYHLIHKLQAKLLLFSLKCGLTQVASYQFMDAHMEYFTVHPGSPFSQELKLLGGDTGDSDMNGHYHIAHFGSTPGNVANYAVKNALDAWHVKQFAEFVKELRSTPEGAGTMLDSTVVVLINQFNNGGSHYIEPSPLLIAGSGGGLFKPGQVVNCKRQPLNKLYVSLCHAMGLTSIDSFGTDKYGRGVLEGVS